MLGSSLHGFDASVSTAPDNSTQPLLATLNNPGVIHKPDSQVGPLQVKTLYYTRVPLVNC